MSWSHCYCQTESQAVAWTLQTLGYSISSFPSSLHGAIYISMVANIGQSLCHQSDQHSILRPLLDEVYKHFCAAAECLTCGLQVSTTGRYSI